MKNILYSYKNLHKSCLGTRKYDPLDKFPQISASPVFHDFFYTTYNEISKTKKSSTNALFIWNV